MELLSSVLETLHFDPILFGFQFCSFFVLHFLLKVIIYDPLMAARRERDQKIGGKLQEAESLAAQARAVKDRYDEAIHQARLEAQQLLQTATREAEQEKAVKVAGAREEARQVVEEAEAGIQRQREEALKELEGDIKSLSTSIVERLLDKTLEASARDRVLTRVRSAP
ncbi:MAG: F0F1 ATP synthase subunit B [Candidatus Eremiobacterota bacterium]